MKSTTKEKKEIEHARVTIEGGTLIYLEGKPFLLTQDTEMIGSIANIKSIFTLPTTNKKQR